jgi:hypothetical protein
VKIGCTRALLSWCFWRGRGVYALMCLGLFHYDIGTLLFRCYFAAGNSNLVLVMRDSTLMRERYRLSVSSNADHGEFE